MVDYCYTEMQIQFSNRSIHGNFGENDLVVCTYRVNYFLIVRIQQTSSSLREIYD